MSEQTRTGGRCPSCGRAQGAAPCQPACAPPAAPGVWSPPAHARKQHPLSAAHTPVAAAGGQTVYVICGFDGCPQRVQVDAAVWQALARRREAAGRAQKEEGGHV